MFAKTPVLHPSGGAVLVGLRHESDEFSSDVVYTSRYTKDVEIVPGKMLKLIFPPDTPSVRGFDIEDTLIIVPQ